MTTTPGNGAPSLEGALAIDEAMRALTLEQKVALVSGGGFWETVAIPEIGLRPIVFSDGPAGVRGGVWDERDPSVSFPSPVALGAAWSCELARSYGAALASEARRKGIDVVLAPVLNLQRSPRGGRNHEALSEDPLLAGTLGSEIITGLQANGVGAVAKHYVLNETETDRMSVSISAPPRALHELYLAPFEDAVRAGVWATMSAYVSVDGTPMSENTLLTDPLITSWKFDGVVVSDWSAVRSIAAANANVHLAMPGPNPVWSAGLADAVRSGEISTSSLNEKVRRILLLAHRVGAWRRAPGDMNAPDPAIVARAVATRGIVLLKNESRALPLPDNADVAVIGYRAVRTRQQGGGSARVVPDPRREDSIVAALRRRLGDHRVTFAAGSLVDRALRPLPADGMRLPGGGSGILVRFHMSDGTVREETRFSSELIWLGTAPDDSECRSIELLTEFTPETTESIELCVASTGRSTLYVDGTPVLDGKPDASGVDEVAVLMTPPVMSAEFRTRAGVPLSLRLTHDLEAHPSVPRSASVILGSRPIAQDPEVLLSQAEEVARDAEYAIVVVGTSDADESEGSDRASLSLGAEQDALVERVASANPRTIVVVNAGSPVLMPWLDRVAGVVAAWIGGEAGPSALASVLTGDAEPAGRLPFSWPAAEGGELDPSVIATDGVLLYAEDVNGGYRSRERPAFAFGHGLGYSEIVIESAETRPDADGLAVVVDVRNTGVRFARAVPQVYVTRAASGIPRPQCRLAGFGDVDLAPGERARVSISVPRRVFRHWDVSRRAWTVEPGEFALRVADSALANGLSLTALVDDAGNVL